MIVVTETVGWYDAAVRRTVAMRERLRLATGLTGAYVLLALIGAFVQTKSITGGFGGSGGWLLWWWASAAVAVALAAIASLGWLICGRLVDLAAPPPPAEPAVDHIR
jgi:hypothetical protein